MIQYLELLQTIKDKGTKKPAARKGMPGSTSLFGYQFRHNLADGFPLLTTKKINFKHIVTELLWFLKGDTNIKYLVDNGCNIWNEDAYNYYVKKCNEQNIPDRINFDVFIDIIKNSAIGINGLKYPDIVDNIDTCVPEYYTFGDCGYQYGKIWRNWNYAHTAICEDAYGTQTKILANYGSIDQIKNLIEGLKNTPESRRHILTSIDPAHDNDLALYWCHALTQFNCRPLNLENRLEIWFGLPVNTDGLIRDSEHATEIVDDANIPKYYLDCQMYQRSADVFLGAPYNIASYALITHILCKICNMIPGEMIYSYGDVHIYDNHIDQVNEQLTRIPTKLPHFVSTPDVDKSLREDGLDNILSGSIPGGFGLFDYYPQPAIKAKLSTGLK